MPKFEIKIRNMDRLLIKNAVLDGRRTDIYVENGKIVSVGNCTQFEADKTIDANGMRALPGFVNMHTHAAMTLMRGVEEDLPLAAWLKRIWKIEESLDEESIYWGTRLACLEMLKSGTTAFNDQYWMPDVAVKAVNDSGLRSWNSYVCMDHGSPERAARERDELEQTYEKSREWGPMCSFTVGCHSTYEVSREMLEWCRDFAVKYGLKLHIHVSETRAEVENCRSRYGMSPVKYLDSLGMLGPHLIAAHTLWLDEEDVELLGKHHVNVVHNINSNLKIASGYRFLYNELAAAGANVTLGTDGCASSNNLDMLEAMKTAAMVQKAWRADPKVMPLNELLDIATINGAKALGLESGRIEAGKQADILLVNVRKSTFVPEINFLSNFVYSGHSDAIDTVICAGRVLMEGRRVKDEDEILDSAGKAARVLLEKSGIVLKTY